MTDIKVYEGLTANQQLNLFRNLYYNDGNTTEKGIIANAINDILPEYNRQKAEIERLKEEVSKARRKALLEAKGKFAGHSDYHGDTILCKLICMAEGKEVGIAKPLDTNAIKAEAIKEFAETVKDKQYHILRAHCNMDVICECDDCIDGLVKERTGEQK